MIYHVWFLNADGDTYTMPERVKAVYPHRNEFGSRAGAHAYIHGSKPGMVRQCRYYERGEICPICLTPERIDEIKNAKKRAELELSAAIAHAMREQQRRQLEYKLQRGIA